MYQEYVTKHKGSLKMTCRYWGDFRYEFFICFSNLPGAQKA